MGESAFRKLVCCVLAISFPAVMFGADIGAAMLYTISFQAPGFYERHGWREFGRIPCDPPGTSRIFMTIALAAPAASKDADPNRIICEKQEEIGTRLGGRKVCKTAAQWAAQRQQEQLDVQKEQQMITGTPSSH